jgi:Na+/phosphate symporter
MAKSTKIVAAIVVFLVAFGLAFMGLSYANNLTPTTEGISAFFAIFMGVWISTFF